MILHLLYQTKEYSWRLPDSPGLLGMISIVPYTYLQEQKVALIINHRLSMTICNLLLFDFESVWITEQSIWKIVWDANPVVDAADPVLPELEKQLEDSGWVWHHISVLLNTSWFSCMKSKVCMYHDIVQFDCRLFCVVSSVDVASCVC